LGESSYRCTYYYVSAELGSGLALTKPSAKIQAAQKALEYLRSQCYSVVIKTQLETSEETVSRAGMIQDIMTAIPSSNIGSQLLKKMGWTSGGLGKTGQGIAEPVTTKTIIKREGLGLDAEKGIPKNFLPKIQSIIHKYARSNDQKDLMFEAEFSKEERAIIHKEAQAIGLKSQSYGKGDNRHITLKRKRNPVELYRYIMDMGGETDKYRLVSPKALAV